MPKRTNYLVTVTRTYRISEADDREHAKAIALWHEDECDTEDIEVEEIEEK